MSRFVISDKTILVPTGVEEALVEQADGTYRKVTLSSISDLAAETATLDLTAAEILAINTTEQTIVAAPGAGKAIQILGAVAKYTFVTTAYTLAGTDLALYETDSTGTRLLTFTLSGGDNLLDEVATTTRQARLINDVETLSENVPIVATVNTGDPTLGDSTVKIQIVYKTITV